MTTDEKYSRASFDDAKDPEPLARELGAHLTERIRRVAAPGDEVRGIVDELRSLGHDLWSWDEDDDSQTWGGDYARPQPKRMIVEFRYQNPETTTVEVTFGPWPPRQPNPACLGCGIEMRPSSLRVRGIGHGCVTDAPPTRLEMSLGELDAVTATCGARSTGYEVPAFWCAACAGLWIPNARAGGWIG